MSSVMIYFKTYYDTIHTKRLFMLIWNKLISMQWSRIFNKVITWCKFIIV